MLQHCSTQRRLSYGVYAIVEMEAGDLKFEKVQLEVKISNKLGLSHLEISVDRG